MGCRIKLTLRIFLFSWPVLIGVLLVSGAPAQPSRPANSSSPAGSAATSKKSTESTPASSVEPATEEVINSLSLADVQAAIALLKGHFTDPKAVSETELSRATLEGLTARLGTGLALLASKATAAPEKPAPFYGEILNRHIGYLRPGTFSAAALQAMEKKIGEFAAKRVDALVIDLRASNATDFGIAAEFANRFVVKGKTLFSLRRQGKKDQVFISNRDPVYDGLLVLLADGDTTGGAEAFASALRFYDKALVIGKPTAGHALEYSDFPLPGGTILRVAVAECIGPDGHSLYPDGIQPDLSVDLSPVEKRQIFQASQSKGMGPFIHETERPHLNEAALIAGTNPELETSEQRRVRIHAAAIYDPVLERALDLVTSVEIYQKR